MLPYYAIFTFLAFLSLAESQSVKRKQRSLLLSGVWLLLTLFAGLRYNNADWNSYFDFYKILQMVPEKVLLILALI